MRHLHDGHQVTSGCAMWSPVCVRKLCQPAQGLPSLPHQGHSVGKGAHRLRCMRPPSSGTSLAGYNEMLSRCAAANAIEEWKFDGALKIFLEVLDHSPAQSTRY